MTYEDAKQKAIEAFMAQGLSRAEAEAAVTPADIKNWGWVPTDPTANCDTSVILTPEQLDEHGAAALEEAKGNQFLSNLLPALIGMAKKGLAAIGLFLALVLFTGCASTAGRQLADDAKKSVETYSGEVNPFAIELIKDKLAKNCAEADANYDASVKSHTTYTTKTVQKPLKVRQIAADGTATEKIEYETEAIQVPNIDPRIMTALQLKKAQDYATAADIAAKEYARLARININAANAARSLNELSAYLNEQAKSQMGMTQALAYANEVLDAFLAPKGEGQPVSDPYGTLLPPPKTGP